MGGSKLDFLSCYTKVSRVRGEGGDRQLEYVLKGVWHGRFSSSFHIHTPANSAEIFYLEHLLGEQVFLKQKRVTTFSCICIKIYKYV